MKRIRTLGLMLALAVAATVSLRLGLQMTQVALAQTAAATPPAADGLAKTALESYAKAINERNHEAIAGFWADAAEHIDDEGVTTTGKAAIVALFKKTLAENPKLSVKLSATAARLVGNDVMLVDGVAETKNGADTDTSRFESIWVRSGTAWQLSRVRELPAPPAVADNNYDRLKELEWMIGDWTAASGKYTVELSAKWNRNKNFIHLTQVVKLDGAEHVTITKLIGWDPIRGQIRSWLFDTDGGFGGALFSRNGNSWVQTGESVTRNGGESTATQITKFIDENTFEWTATDRQMDDKPLPDIALKYTRKPAAK